MNFKSNIKISLLKNLQVLCLSHILFVCWFYVISFNELIVIPIP